MITRRLSLVALLLVTACGGSADLAREADLRLPTGDRIVRTQPGLCEQDCVVSDAAYESVTEVAGVERSDEALGEALTASLADAGWAVVPDGPFGYGAAQARYPSRWQRGEGGRRSYLYLFPIAPGSYGLAYDADGDSVTRG